MSRKHMMKFAGIALAIAGSSAFAQGSNTLPQITVQASHGVTQKQVGRTSTGIPIEQVQLSRRVGYSDLDLSTSAGQAALETRIKTVAQEACKQLQTLYPLEQWDTDNRTCVAEAVQQAMQQAKSAAAAASKK
jgi:UrcA family protein